MASRFTVTEAFQPQPTAGRGDSCCTPTTSTPAATRPRRHAVPTGNGARGPFHAEIERRSTPAVAACLRTMSPTAPADSGSGMADRRVRRLTNSASWTPAAGSSTTRAAPGPRRRAAGSCGCGRAWSRARRLERGLVAAARRDRDAPASIRLAAALLDVREGEASSSERLSPARARSSRIARSRTPIVVRRSGRARSTDSSRSDRAVGRSCWTCVQRTCATSGSAPTAAASRRTAETRCATVLAACPPGVQLIAPARATAATVNVCTDASP